MSTLKRFFRDTFIYGLASVLPRIINFLLVRVQTDALATNNYAVNTDFYIWAALFSVILTFGIETAFFRFYNTEEKKDTLISTSFISMLFTVSLFVLAIVIFYRDFINFFDFEENPVRLQLLMGILALDTISTVPFAYLRASSRPIRYAVIKLINVGVIVVLNLLCLKYIPLWIAHGSYVPEFIKNNFYKTSLVNYIFIANLLGSAISFSFLIPYLLKFKFQFDFELLKKMYVYSWPIAVAGIAYVINENLDKFLIKRMIGDSEMGIYSASYKLAIFMNLYILAFRLGAEPFFFNHAGNSNAKEIYARIMNYFVIIGSFVFIGIVAYIDILKHFINPNYWGALAIVPIVLLANLFVGIYHNLAVWYKLTDKTRYGMYFSLIGALVTIILNIWFIPIMGIMASAWATLAAYACMAIISYFVGKKYYYVKYDLRKMGSYLGAASIISTLSFLYFRNNLIISTLFIVLYALLIFWNEKNEILILIKRK